jgi:hypothetical protein
MCRDRATLNLDHEIAMACAGMAEMSEEKDRHDEWDRIKIMLGERARRGGLT